MATIVKSVSWRERGAKGKMAISYIVDLKYEGPVSDLNNSKGKEIHYVTGVSSKIAACEKAEREMWKKYGGAPEKWFAYKVDGPKDRFDSQMTESSYPRGPRRTEPPVRMDAQRLDAIADGLDKLVRRIDAIERDCGPDCTLTTPGQGRLDAWSDEARKAAAEARRFKAEGRSGGPHFEAATRIATSHGYNAGMRGLGVATHVHPSGNSVDISSRGSEPASWVHHAGVYKTGEGIGYKALGGHLKAQLKRLKDEDRSDSIRTDSPVSEAQRRAMRAAAGGNSTLGISKSVGKEFSEADPGGKLPETKKDAVHP